MKEFEKYVKSYSLSSVKKDAIKAVSHKLRTRALTLLKKKNTIIDLIEKREITLMTLEGLYDKVGQAHTEAEVGEDLSFSECILI